METLTRIAVATGVPYEVVVGAGAAAELPAFVRARLPRVARVALVADSNVDRLHGDRFARLMEDAGLPPERIVFPAGEKSKTLSSYVDLVGALATFRFARTDLVVALGGGVTGDLAGFAAATYMRGIDFIQVPTTLLAMVDSSVGGKTGVDLEEGKNLVGAFHQPRAVFCDPSFLATLPETWRVDGMGEVVKYAVLGDPELFGRLESAPRAPIGLADIARCIGQKRDVVARDEFEAGDRKLLNLGHTFGHAIEKLSGYGVSHGRAVATGLALSARASERLGLLAPDAAARIASLVGAMGYETTCPYAEDAMADAMAGDKKVSGASVDLVLPVAVGRCVVRRTPLAELVGLLR